MAPQSSPPPPRPDPDAPPTPEEAQEAIRQQLIQAEMAVRDWLNSPAGRRAVATAKSALPVAGIAALAGAAAWGWWALHTKRQHVERKRGQIAGMRPVLEEAKPTLDYLRQTLVGRTEKQVQSLIGPPLAIEDEAGRWLYPLSDEVDEESPDGAALAIDFNAEGRVQEVVFLTARRE